MPTPDPNIRRILVTGDDFGRNPEVDAAMEAYHRAGALHQASVMVAAPHAAETVKIAERNPGLRVGLHLVLCDGIATARSALTDAARVLPKSPAAAGWRYALVSGLREALRAEIARQFEQFLALGFPPTYWDGHTHLHLHPTIFALTLPIARRHGFTFTRLVREPGPPRLLPTIFRLLSAAAAPRLRAAEIGFADRVFGLRHTGRMSLACFHEALRQAREGVTEIYFHPGAEADPPEPGALAEALRAASTE